RIGRARGDEGSPRLGAARQVLGGAERREGRHFEERVREDRGAGGRAPVSHEGLVPGALDRIAGAQGGAATTRGAAERQDGDRRRSRGARRREGSLVSRRSDHDRSSTKRGGTRKESGSTATLC